jgi:DNA-binding NtrC family response regulator
MLNVTTPGQNNVAILAVIPNEGDRKALRAIFLHSNWLLSFAGSIAEAKRFLERSAVPVILCERDLPDGSWKDLLSLAMTFDHPPCVIVTSGLADERLWAEALNVGCHDVLPRPFDHGELFRALCLAWRTWHEKNEIGGASSRTLATAG